MYRLRFTTARLRREGVGGCAHASAAYCKASGDIVPTTTQKGGEAMKEKTRLNIGLVLMVILLSANMRASYTGVGTIVDLIQADLGLNSTVAGLITTVPLIVFAITCPIASGLSQRISIGKMIEAALVIICVGVGLRAIFGAVGLFAGTAIMSAGVGIMNSVMIALIKLRFPGNVGLVSALYTTTMSLTTAASMAVNVPLSGVLGWRGVLGMWVLAAIPAIILWAPQAGREINRGSSGAGEGGLMKKMLCSPRAWLMLGYMGTQSMLFYCISAWLPSILQWRGMEASAAAGVATAMQIISLSTTLLIPIFMEKMNWRVPVLFSDACYIVGAVVFFFCPPGGVVFWISIVLLGLGVGTHFSACIFLFSARTASPAEASAISGFAQSGGYVFAAVGPVLMGRFFDMSGSWNAAMGFWFAVMLAMSLFSFFATEKRGILAEK